MDALFNIVCFSLSVAVIAAALCSFSRVSAVRKELAENEAQLLLRKARSAAASIGADTAVKVETAELTGLAAQLSDAGVHVSTKLWLGLRTGCGIAAGLACFVLASSSAQQGGYLPGALAGAIAYAACILGFKKYLAAKAKKQVLLFEKQLAQIEMQIAENSRGGLPITRSILSCVDLAQEPLKGHLKRLYNEMTYSNCTLADGFSNMAKRTHSQDAHLLANVIAVQQRTGSNLADALDFLHETISRRLEMRQSLQSSLAETKITRSIVSVMPWAIFALLAFAPLIKIDGFWEFYSSNPLGWAVLGGCALIEAAILVLISKMSDLKLD